MEFLNKISCSCGFTYETQDKLEADGVEDILCSHPCPNRPAPSRIISVAEAIFSIPGMLIVLIIGATIATMSGYTLKL